MRPRATVPVVCQTRRWRLGALRERGPACMDKRNGVVVHLAIGGPEVRVGRSRFRGERASKRDQCCSRRSGWSGQRARSHDARKARTPITLRQLAWRGRCHRFRDQPLQHRLGGGSTARRRSSAQRGPRASSIAKRWSDCAKAAATSVGNSHVHLFTHGCAFAQQRVRTTARDDGVRPRHCDSSVNE